MKKGGDIVLNNLATLGDFDFTVSVSVGVLGSEEVIRYLERADKAGIEWLTVSFNVIFTKHVHEWRWSTMVPLYKNKRLYRNCNNYRGIKLLSHTMKIRERNGDEGEKRGVHLWNRALIHAETIDYRPLSILCVRPVENIEKEETFIRCSSTLKCL
ncbi:hypothetical protein H5410_001395 [Solanum commersonii]|uniref:Uncharacterized protein n=1 Tax=Solanum commersonii TaxID=4109 RepID=A0A9J6AYU0_SOLCO|nr:hypothetical protein H5410_001395 [Solanum commersonii]